MWTPLRAKAELRTRVRMSSAPHPFWPTPPLARTRACNGARPRRRPRPARRPNTPEYARISPLSAGRSRRLERKHSVLLQLGERRPYSAAGPWALAAARCARIADSRPPPEYARLRSPMSTGFSRRLKRKHSVLLQLGERRPYSATGPWARCARTTAPPTQPPAARICSNTPPEYARIHSPMSAGLSRTHREALGAAAG